MFVCRVENEGNISFTTYENVKGKNRAEGAILPEKFPSLRMFYYAGHFSDLSVW
jgi:hypothetical protein